MTIAEKKQLLIDNHTKATAIDSKAKQENRDLTKEERSEFDSILNESEAIRSELAADEKRAAQMAGLDEYLSRPIAQPKAAGDAVAAPEEKSYRTLGDWIATEQRDITMGGQGGILIPDQFRPGLLKMGGEGSIVRPRATVIGAGDPPDAKITIPVLNQGGANGVYANMTMTWIDEGGTKADTTPELTYIELEPKELGGSTIITDKERRNAPVIDMIVNTLFRELINGKGEYCFLRGNGVGCPTGVLGCAAEKTVTRGTASSVVFADISSMLAALPASSWGKAVWVANQSVLPKIISLADAASNSIFIQGDVTKSIPASLFGLPIVFTGKTPALGTKGDLMLCDFSYYLIKDGSGPFIAMSEHVYFTTNKTVVKAFTMVDGAPWVKSTLLLEDATTTVSPFVVLV